MWNVRIVSCVPGSPIDWAAITPTASPMIDRQFPGQGRGHNSNRKHLPAVSHVSTERILTRWTLASALHAVRHVLRGSRCPRWQDHLAGFGRLDILQPTVRPSVHPTVQAKQTFTGVDHGLHRNAAFFDPQSNSALMIESCATSTRRRSDNRSSPSSAPYRPDPYGHRASS